MIQDDVLILAAEELQIAFIFWRRAMLKNDTRGRQIA